MTSPHRTDLPGTPPPYNPRPGFWSGVPRSVLVGGAAVVVVLVVIAIISLTGGSGDEDSDKVSGAAATAGATTSAVAFAPNITEAKFGDGWRDKKTNKLVIPPQRIKITGTLDLTEKVESIGYGATEQSLPKIGESATTDTSFPISPELKMFVSSGNTLRLNWQCEILIRDPASKNCQDRYSLIIDISGSAPAVSAAMANNREDGPEVAGAGSASRELLAVANPEQLPSSVVGTDEGTGATKVVMLAATQPNEYYKKVYFVVNDSLKLYIGELESSS